MPEPNSNQSVSFAPEQLKTISSKPDVAKIDILKRFITRAEPHRSKAIEMAYKCQAYRRNHFRVDAKYVQDVLTLQEEELKDDRAYHSIPFTLGLTMLRVARYMALEPVWTVSMETANERDRAVSEVSHAMLRRVVDPERETEKSLLIDSMCFGAHSVFKVVWDDLAGMEVREPLETLEQTDYPIRTEPLVEFEMGGETYQYGKRVVYHQSAENGKRLYKSHQTGGPTFRALGPTEFNMDPLGFTHGIKHARWAFDQQRVSADVIYERYPEHWGKLEKFVWSNKLDVNSADEQVRRVMRHESTFDFAQTAVLTDFYMRPSPNFGLPNGLHAVFITSDSTNVAEGNVSFVILEWEDLNTPGMRLPYFDGAVELQDGKDWWGLNLFMVSSGGQKQANIFWSLASEAAEAGTTLVLGATDTEQEASISATDVENMPHGLLLKVGGKLQDLKVLSGSQTVPLNTAMIDKVIELVESTTLTRGGRADKEELAAQVHRALEQDKSITGLVLRRLLKLYIEASKYALRLMQQHASVSDLSRIAPDYDVDEIRDFMGADLENFLRLKVRGAALIDDPAIILQLAKFLPQFGPEWQKIYPPQVLADMLSLQRGFGETQRDYHIERAERENSRMRREYPTVDLRDDDDVHLYAHGIYYVSNLHRMSDEEKRAFRKHMDKHKDNMVTKLVKEAELAAIARQKVSEVVAKYGPPGPGQGAAKPDQQPVERTQPAVPSSGEPA